MALRCLYNDWCWTDCAVPRSNLGIVKGELETNQWCCKQPHPHLRQCQPCGFRIMILFTGTLLCFKLIIRRRAVVPVSPYFLHKYTSSVRLDLLPFRNPWAAELFGHLILAVIMYLSPSPLIRLLFTQHTKVWFQTTQKIFSPLSRGPKARYVVTWIVSSFRVLLVMGIDPTPTGCLCRSIV